MQRNPSNSYLNTRKYRIGSLGRNSVFLELLLFPRFIKSIHSLRFRLLRDPQGRLAQTSDLSASRMHICTYAFIKGLKAVILFSAFIKVSYSPASRRVITVHTTIILTITHMKYTTNVV